MMARGRSLRFIEASSRLYAQTFSRLCVMARWALCYKVMLLVVLWFVLFEKPLIQAVCNGVANSSHACGELFYDNNLYTCCSQTITLGRDLSCCGNKAYHYTASSCCNNEVTYDLSEEVSYCCGHKAYNPVNEICCNNIIMNKTSAHTECCGSDVYDTKTQLCCSKRNVHTKKTEKDICCCNGTINPEQQCCCPDCTAQYLANNTCCNNHQKNVTDGKQKAGQPTTSPTVPNDSQQSDTKDSAPFEKASCGTSSLSPPNGICCSGKASNRKAGVTQCCGEESYELSEDGVLCCEGRLYRGLSPGHVCSGSVAYLPQNCTVCQKELHLPPGRLCCGHKTFDPETEICCNGHKHQRSENGTACCGPHAYIPSTGKQVCCSGHLHDLSSVENKGNAGCCGPLLLTNKEEQQCCHSAEKTLVYKTKPGHSCCGHFYYKMSLWSCCAGRLISKPTNASAMKTIQHLTDFEISEICNQTVLLGSVESVAVNKAKRYVVLKSALEVKNSVKVTFRGYSFVIGPIDHCRFPALELGQTYLWLQNSSKNYEPFADLSNLITPLHNILSLCQSKPSG